MLRYKTKTRPGLVALYDIRPGNRAGPFLQPQSLHGALMHVWHLQVWLVYWCLVALSAQRGYIMPDIYLHIDNRTSKHHVTLISEFQW